MDNHPIPQDITGFQFKLIGNMTIRQFVYLAAGVVVAFFIFFILPIPFLIKLPLSIIFLIIGASFAFVPISGRPMDTMVSNFFKALSAQTQYIYQKTGGDLSKTQNFADIETQTNAQNQVSANPSVSPVDSSVNSALATPPPPPITNELEASIMQVAPVSSTPMPALQSVPEPAAYGNVPSPSIQEYEEMPAATEVESVIAGQSELQKLLLETQRQKEALEKELLVLKSKLESQNGKKTQNVRKVPQGLEKTAGVLSIPQEPNLITGIIKDPRGNLLQNILVEVKDSEDNPVRAFKTNELGQFASATPLNNGKYVLTFEDSKGEHKFDAVEIEVVGSAVLPLEIISVDPREELRRQLFS